MGLIVQKFGGSSVANVERVFNVARIITETYSKGNNVVVVVSAQEYVKKMYEGVGFEIISDTYNEVNIPHVKMIMRL